MAGLAIDSTHMSLIVSNPAIMETSSQSVLWKLQTVELECCRLEALPGGCQLSPTSSDAAMMPIFESCDSPSSFH